MFTHIGSAVAIVDIKRTQDAWWNEQYEEHEPSRLRGIVSASLSNLIRSRRQPVEAGITTASGGD